MDAFSRCVRLDWRDAGGFGITRYIAPPGGKGGLWSLHEIPFPQPPYICVCAFGSMEYGIFAVLNAPLCPPCVPFCGFISLSSESFASECPLVLRSRSIPSHPISSSPEIPASECLLDKHPRVILDLEPDQLHPTPSPPLFLITHQEFPPPRPTSPPAANLANRDCRANGRRGTITKLEVRETCLRVDGVMDFAGV